MKNNMKMGTPAMGIAVGLGMVGVAVLIMLIGFWNCKGSQGD